MEPFGFTAAGHAGAMQSTDGCMFYKPLDEVEAAFYGEVVKRMGEEEGEGDPSQATLDQFITPFYGQLVTGVSSEVPLSSLNEDMLRRADYTAEVGGTSYLVLKNLVYGYSMPLVVDVKLGRILWDKGCGESKRKRMEEVSKTTTSGTLGWRVCGVKAVIPENMISDSQVPEKWLRPLKGVDYKACASVSGNTFTLNKQFGRSLTTTTAREGLEMALRCNALPRKLQDEIISRFVLRLELFYNCLLDTEVRSISSSLLFVVEGDPARWEGLEDSVFYEDQDEDDEYHAPLSELRWIDFAHTRFTPNMGYDEELLFGVEKLLDSLAHDIK